MMLNFSTLQQSRAYEASGAKTHQAPLFKNEKNAFVTTSFFCVTYKITFVILCT